MEVEVVFPRVCGAFYQAYIQDFNLDNGSASLSFPKEWKPSVWVELSYIRFPQDPSATPPLTLGVGSKVEALLPHHDNEPPGWWTGTLLKSRGELHVVEFQSGTEKYQDIVDHDKLRSPNTNLPLSKNKMFKNEYQVMEELDDYCQRRGVHENFRSKIKAVCVSYDRTNRVLVVLATNEACLNRASLLIEMHFRDLRTQKSLLSRSEMAAQRYHQHQTHHVLETGVKEIRFHVPTELVGMAIGREGANVNEARKISGVTSVEFDDYSSMFSVKGESDEAMQKARERLEFGREMMLIPRNLAGKVIGKKGNVIQEILEKSRVHNVKVVGEEEAKDRDIDVQAQVPFDFIGRKSEIDNAKMMMEYHLDHLKSVEKILQSSKDLDTVPNHDETYFPAPNVTRGFRGGPGRGRGGRGGYRGGNRPVRPRESQTTEEDEESPPPSNVREPEADPARQHSEEIFHSDDESDSNSNQEQPDHEEGSAPEDDEQGPDRRRQPRGSVQGARGGQGGYNRRGGGRGRGRGGRGYRNQRQGRAGGGRYRGSDDRGPPPPPSTHDTNYTSSEYRVASSGAIGGGNQEGAEPKPQRQGRGRQRGNPDRRGGSSGGRINRSEEQAQQVPTSGDGGNSHTTVEPSA